MSKELSYYNKEFLGRGSYGCVYLGLFNGDKVAVKLIQKGYYDGGSRKFLREVDALKKVGEGDHPHILRFMHNYTNTDSEFL